MRLSGVEAVARSPMAVPGIGAVPFGPTSQPAVGMWPGYTPAYGAPADSSSAAAAGGEGGEGGGGELPASSTYTVGGGSVEVAASAYVEGLMGGRGSGAFMGEALAASAPPMMQTPLGG